MINWKKKEWNSQKLGRSFIDLNTLTNFVSWRFSRNETFDKLKIETNRIVNFWLKIYLEGRITRTQLQREYRWSETSNRELLQVITTNELNNDCSIIVFLQRIRNHSLTSLCIISHHPFFSMFRECLFVLKKIIDACNESSSPQKVGASRQTNRYRQINPQICKYKSNLIARLIVPREYSSLTFFLHRLLYSFLAAWKENRCARYFLRFSVKTEKNSF